MLGDSSCPGRLEQEQEREAEAWEVCDPWGSWKGLEEQVLKSCAQELGCLGSALCPIVMATGPT